MKTKTQEIGEYIEQLENLLKQSDLIKQEIQRQITFEHLQNRIGGIEQQVEFIRSQIIPKTAEEKAKYYKHNKLALKLINRHLAEIEKTSDAIYLKKHKEDDQKWELIEQMREEILENLEHIEAALQEALLAQQYNEIELETKDIALFEGEVAELANKVELLLQEVASHAPLSEGIFEQIHHLHHDLQFIKLHAYSRDHSYEPHQAPSHEQYHDFLQHHYQAIQDVGEHLMHLHNHWGEMLHELYEENYQAAEVAKIHEEIKHTIDQFEDKLKEIEENKIHYLQQPGAHIVPIKFDKE